MGKVEFMNNLSSAYSKYVDKHLKLNFCFSKEIYSGKLICDYK
jgi:hypothetical protein